MNQIKSAIASIRQQLAPADTSLPSIKLVAVSKTHPETAILEALAAGQTDFGENYVQELANKAANLKEYPICWHFIGHIQSNKTRQIAQYANWVHTLTKLQHAIRLNNQRPADLPVLNVLIEVNISNEASKNGLTDLEEIYALALEIAILPMLKLRGLMGMASDTTDLALIKSQFLKLVQIRQELNQRGLDLDQLSMGMSNDYPIAIECGATMVRIGSKIFGKRIYDN